MQMDSKLPLDTFESVMQLAIEGCKAIANYVREVRTSILSTDLDMVMFFGLNILYVNRILIFAWLTGIA